MLRPADIVLAVLLLLLGTVVFFFGAGGAGGVGGAGGQTGRESGEVEQTGAGDVGGLVAVVMVDGAEYGRYPLSGGNQDVYVKTADRFSKKESFNIVAIEGGQVSIVDADCPGQVCVESPAINKTGQNIICLPHRLIVKLEGGKSDIDAYTF